MSTLRPRLGACLYVNLVPYLDALHYACQPCIPVLVPAIMSTLRPRLGARHYINLAFPPWCPPLCQPCVPVLVPAIMSTFMPKYF